VLLSDGRILFTGGTGTNGPLATTELFNTDGSFAPAAPMQDARTNHIAVLLKDGRVLVSGGTSAGGSITNSAEIYDVAANSWTQLAGGMNIGRSGHTASLLSDGRVLIAGGQSTSGATDVLEMFSPGTGSFSAVSSGTLSSPRQQHAAAVLQDGNVLIAGGSDGTNSLNTSDIFDPGSESISAGPNMSAPRAGLSATTLLDGTVLVAGGNNGTADLASAEVYDPAAGTFSAKGSLATPRTGHLAFLLPNNNEVLIAGGTSAGAPLSSAELFVPWAGSFSATGAMATARTAAAGSPSKQNGRLLVAGGSNGTNPLAGGELYSFATVTTDQPDYAVGTAVNVSGSGWQPGETVTLTLVESPLIDTHGPYTAVADSNGNISSSQFVTDLHDVNVRFYLTAKGSVSQAQTTFFDAAAAVVVFATDSPCAATGTASGTNNGGGALNQAFTTGKPSASIGTQPNTSVTYTYASTVTCGAATYTFASATPASGFQSGAANSTTTVTAHYVLTSVTTKLTVSVPSPASVTFGSTGLVALSATLTRNDTNAGVAGATVTFTVDGTSVGTGGTNTSGVASFSYNPSSLTAGNHPVQATFAAQTITAITYLASTSGTQILGVGAPTALVLSAPNPASVTLGSTGPVALSATLTRTDSHAAVSGATITFTVDGTSVGSPTTTTASGVASLSYNPSSLAAGPHTVQASFAGQTISATVYSASTSGPQTLTVNNSATTTQVRSSVSPSTFGQSVTFTGTVTSASGTPTGSVTFYDGTSCGTGPVLASAVALSAGVAGFSTSTLTATSHTILACYSPTGTFTASSGSLVQQVGKATPVITWANPADIPYGTPLGATQLNATASVPGSFVYTPAGGTVLGVGIGQALSASFTPTDTTNYTTPVTQSVHVNVLLATPVVSGSGPGTSSYGQAVTLSVTITPPAGGTPGGSVTFSFIQNSTTYYVCPDGSVTPATPACTVPISTTPNSAGAYVASVTTSHLPPGTDGVVATYSGDSNFQGEPANVGVTVSQADTATTLTKSPDPSNYGNAVALTVKVKDNTANSTGVPTGTVTLSFKLDPTDPTAPVYNVCADGSIGTVACGSRNQITLAADSTDSTGVTATATVNTTKLPVGLSTAQFAYSLNASYSGDTNFNASSLATGLSQTVNQRPITVTAATDTKPYDGNTSSSVKPTITSGTLLTGDTANFTQTFDSRNAGTGKTLTPTGSVNDGFSGNNYAVTFTPVNTGTITPLAITVTAVMDKKTYDGTTNSKGSPTIAPDLISPDASSFTQAFSTKNVGTNLTLTPSGVASDGNGGNNYKVTFVNSTGGVITAAPLTITAVTYTKTYDGTTAVPATVVPTVAGLQTGDSVSNVSEVYDSPNAGARTLSVAATYTISDSNNGNNYAVTPVSVSGTVNQAPLTITAPSFSRYYGVATQPFTGTYLGFVNGETSGVLAGTLSCTTVATTGSDVGMYPTTCSGQTSTNYAINYVPGTLTILSAPTSTVLTSAVTGSSGAANVTFTAAVGSAFTPAIPGGSVKFVDTSNNNAVLGTAALVSGRASLPPVTSLSVGTHLISATYTPGSNPDFLGSSAQDPNTTLGAIITAPNANNDVFAVNTNIPLSATFTATTTATPSAIWSLTNTASNASLTPVAGAVSGSNITGSASFANADVYAFTLTVTDGVGGIVIGNTVAGLPTTIVIYDPNAGFVTGGGWINSPVGAYTQNPALTGKATFGFVSKYQKGATVPTGNTEFQFQVANFNFHSISYQWMVVSGSLAQYKGSGTVNGSGNYNFLLTALDGSLAGGGTLDGFRMKITDPATNTVVYDNLVSSDDTMQAKNTEALGDKGVGGGSIMIHSK
jgi:trimeric autotransporter adhesin